MSHIKNIFPFILLLLVITGCKQELNDDLSFLNSAVNAGKVSALFEITQDNTGNVTITPNGEGAVSYDVYYGDGGTTFVKVQAGKSTTHKYAEGVYNVKLVAYNITGKTTEATQQLTVSFRAPENLQVTADLDVANNFKVNVTASALYETMFRVYFGDVPNEVPVSFMEGETISHTYAAVGTYTVRVVALSGGAATTEFTKTITIVDPVLLPLTFESSTLVFNWGNFGGGVVTVIDNPNKTGINTTNRVGRMVKNAPEVWGGSVITLGAPIDFSANKVFRMKVYSPRVGAKVLLKVENATDGGIFFEKEVSTTVANTWEDLVFDYNAINTANSYQKVVLIFDLGTPGDGSANFTFLFDDIRLTNQIPTVPLALPVTFDLPGVNYSVTDFGGATTVNDVDPANAANKVKKTTKPTGAASWAGTTIGAYFTSEIPFTATETQMSIRVYSPAAGIRVRLKVEDHTNNTRSVETEAMTTAADTWETLVFDFANQSAGTAALNLSYNYDMASVFFNFNVDGDGKVFYWDDVNFLPTNVTPNYVALPLDFQSTTFGYNITDFAGGNLAVIDNPFVNAGNPSSKVARMIKNAGEVYAGSLIGLVNPINFSVKKTFKMKVYSPRVGADVLLKVEGPGGAAFELRKLTTVANAWEEMTFDFSAIDAGRSYQSIVLIFDLGIVGDGSANFTFYVDDISLN
ncbi:PKD domain-containing protein [Lacibacter sp. H407]|uniref:PKD domain-containing protein n=1 Tax=Lacibacter sp. H407 TaxID=3133423 RepID=UPI0030C2FD2B